MNYSLRDDFLLDPDMIFLNHGSFGACPRPVFEAYQRWQRELERQPIDFFSRRAYGLLAQARAELADLVHADPGDLIFVTNATHGANIVARSLAASLGPGNEILTTDQEYGALVRMWEQVAQQTGARFVQCALPSPIAEDEAVIEALWSAVTPRTRLIFVSHITSPTAAILPAAEICRRAREAGILSFIDGAHAPGHIPLDLEALGADFYTGNCHKWLCAPKGSGFLHIRPAQHAVIEPLVVSWEIEDESDLVRRVQWTGTRDIAAFLAVPDAIAFQRAHDWDAVRARCHALAVETHTRLLEWSGLPPLTATGAFAQMFAVRLPPCDMAALKARLWDAYKIEVPVIAWHDRPLLRVSVQGYNTQGDLDTLVSALEEVYASTTHAPRPGRLTM
jgi:isopenicillin-N epimerase